MRKISTGKGNIGVKDVDRESWKFLKVMSAIDGLKVRDELSQIIMEVAKRRGLLNLQKD